ncbi:MAG: BMP family ABC transporter substrate-binding protein, partial [Clostridia bacterium]|nr:BMP family ABC transporter substrate-binding protein [Clostridia bacterium]
MKKFIALFLAALMLFSFASCGGGETTTDEGADKEATETVDLKVGFIFLHDEQSTYDKNFIDAAVAACENMGVTMVQKTQIPESNKCYDAAVELIESDGCDIIFADSFGH